MISKCTFFGASSVYKKNERYPNPLLIVRLIIVFGITIAIPNILAVILALNIGFGLTLLLAFMHIHGNFPVPVPHCLPSCLLRSLVSPHIVNLFAS